MKKFNMIVLLTGMLFLYCKPAPEAIRFGEDACAYCSMGIADPSFAAEIVTEKGRVFKYDSIECMVRSYRKMETEPGLLLVMDYSEPGTFINAKEAHFLISPETRSPMGANLSAFKKESSILEMGLEGSVFDFNALVQHIN